MGINLELYANAYASIIRGDMSGTPYVSAVPKRVAPTRRMGSRCQSCGSHEYVAHQGASLCSYCRTPESAASSVRTSGGELNSEFSRFKKEAELAREKEFMGMWTKKMDLALSRLK